MTRLRLMAAALCLSMVGCRHQATPMPVIPPPAPVAVSSVAGPKTPPLLPTETPPSAPVATVPVVPAVPAKKTRKRPAVVAAPAPVEVAAAPPAAPPVAIGALSAAGEQSGESRKTVSDLIAANDKRLGGLGADVRERQKDQIVRVRNFQGDAQKALAGGDSEGAMTLATKAKVLLDEIAK